MCIRDRVKAGQRLIENPDRRLVDQCAHPVSYTHLDVYKRQPITFEYFNADGKNGNWDNPVAKAITEATGVTLDVSYPVASQGLSLIHI